ncbi:MAG: hypothetical protein JNK82_09125 [Myxococcaceae bacterium]|nr:hypothetical protein [Myxococcaceae bacterium]
MHVVLAADHHGTEVASAVSRRIHDVHDIEHVTVQPEAAPPGDALVQLGTPRRG